jgi:hypothetical protein
MNPNEAKNIANRLRAVRETLDRTIDELEQIHVIEAPEIPGYEYVGYSSSHNPVYREISTERVYEHIGTGLSPYAPTYNHTGGLGRVPKR